MRGLLAALLLALAWAAAGPALAHGVTFAQVDLRLGEEATEIAVTLPVAALLHEAPSSLPPGTTEAELGTDPLSPEVQAALAALLAERLRLASDGEALPLTAGPAFPAGGDVALSATAPPVAGALGVEANLLPTDPLLKVFVNVYRGEELAGQWALDRGNPSFTLDAPSRPVGEVVATFLREGVRHIFIGPDHILFVLALILLGGSVWTQVKIMTAFTVAHSITLTLATLGWVVPPSRLVESLIAASVVVVGLHDLLVLRRGGPARSGPGRDPRAPLAFLFGLIHGFGFARMLLQLDLPREALAWSLAAFNVGVEIGQLLIVLAAAPVFWALRRFAPPLIARGTLAALAGAVVLVGGMWFWQRAVLGA